MKIEEGIRIHADKTKIFINDGVELYDQVDAEAFLQFDDDAYKPKNNWRHLNETEYAKIYSPRISDHYSHNIIIKKLPLSVAEMIIQLELNKQDGYFNVLRRFKENSSLVKELQYELKLLLESYAQNDDMNIHRITYNPPKIETLTYYKTDGHLNFIGLHIDKSSEFDFETVETSQNRICINIGNEDRAIFVINLTLNQMMSLLKTKNLDVKAITIHNIGLHFFKHFPDYPVIKIIQSPNEYYIAPTDNFLHDGSTLDKSTMDITLVYLGFFNTYQSNKAIYFTETDKE